ncbi:hypothetical protein SAMN05443246_2208 [Paenibacillus sp. GP183]|nr:hypothetical protein SAMN05443246_2208 [Paenibacillus sp. GP183]
MVTPKKQLKKAKAVQTKATPKKQLKKAKAVKTKAFTPFGFESPRFERFEERFEPFFFERFESPRFERFEEFFERPFFFPRRFF